MFVGEKIKMCNVFLCNLKTGQRDQPFVSEDEKYHELRTPRPDLLDRPYAPDYSGESFRKQYKVKICSIFTNIF